VQAVDHRRAATPLARAAPAAIAQRRRELGRTPDVHRRRNGAADRGLPAVGGITRGGQRERDDEDGDASQPVHPMRRIPPYADWDRYVSDMMFVPQDSHFASIIWSQPPLPRKKIIATCEPLAKPSITPATVFEIRPFGAPIPSRNDEATYGPCTFLVGFQ
jgi:hypothetical protein